ncbi:MAG TPA: hypothetical protein DDY68_00435 [Porphyromonadaceae bacterium]|nr:hypothetical protein [Porphyromonadaceae bacterium]
MLGAIYTIIGQPGLYEMVSSNKNSFIMRELSTQKIVLFPLRMKSIRVDDVLIYTTGEDVSILKVFQNIFAKEDGKQVEIPSKENTDAFFSYMEKVLPEFDKERVYANNIRKLLQWYNILVSNGKTNFSVEKKEENTETSKEEENK